MDKLHTKRTHELRRLHFTADPTTSTKLDALKVFYTGVLGREVSVTLIVRRALELLQDHTLELTEEPEIKDETITMLRQAG